MADADMRISLVFIAPCTAFGRECSWGAVMHSINAATIALCNVRLYSWHVDAPIKHIAMCLIKLGAAGLLPARLLGVSHFL
jgi:hypothetical protein